MGRRELPDDIPPELLAGDDLEGAPSDPGWLSSLKEKLDHYKGRIFSIIKFCIGLIFLIGIYSGIGAFLKELKNIDPILEADFWAGITTFLVTHLFIFETAKIYQKGHRLLEIVFKFFAPLVKFAPYVLPIYSIIVVSLYALLNAVKPFNGLDSYFMFFFGFSLALHLVFSSKTMRGKQADYLKANYIFGFSLVFLINLGFVALCMNNIFLKFSFVNFFNNAYNGAHSIFMSVLNQIFVINT